MDSGTDFRFQLQGCQLFPSKQGCLFCLQTACKKEIILIDLLNQRECQSEQPDTFQNKGEITDNTFEVLLYTSLSHGSKNVCVSSSFVYHLVLTSKW